MVSDFLVGLFVFPLSFPLSGVDDVPVQTPAFD
jgi:hypothetical protein